MSLKDRIHHANEQRADLLRRREDTSRATDCRTDVQCIARRNDSSLNFFKLRLVS